MDSPDLTTSFVRLAIAFILGLLIGWDRKVRTYSLLAVGTCGLVLVGGSVLGPSAEEHADVVYGIVTGIGFIGSGALLKSPEGSHGMTAMVSLWVTVAIGLAAGYGLYALALAISLLTIAALNVRWPTGSERTDGS